MENKIVKDVYELQVKLQSQFADLTSLISTIYCEHFNHLPTGNRTVGYECFDGVPAMLDNFLSSCKQIGDYTFSDEELGTEVFFRMNDELMKMKSMGLM
jgi:hypothetical protein